VGKDADMPSPPSMRTQTRETLALLWQGRWDVARAAALVPALWIGGYVLFFLLFSVLQDEIIGIMVGGPILLVFWSLIAFYAPAVLLHSLGCRARGEAMPFRQSCIDAAKRLPTLSALAILATSFAFGVSIAIGLTLSMALTFITALALGPEGMASLLGSEAHELSGEALFAGYAIIMTIAILIALPLFLRRALISPMLIVVDGMDTQRAWNRSGAMTSWRQAFAALPFLMPLIANWLLCIGLVYRPVADQLETGLWLSLLLVGFFVLPPLSLMIAAAGSVIPWRDTLNEPDGPKPKPAPQPRPAPTHDIPTSDLIP